ncbi:unnamed protein product [Lota lota]
MASALWSVSPKPSSMSQHMVLGINSSGLMTSCWDGTAARSISRRPRPLLQLHQIPAKGIPLLAAVEGDMFYYIPMATISRASSRRSHRVLSNRSATRRLRPEGLGFTAAVDSVGRTVSRLPLTGSVPPQQRA